MIAYLCLQIASHHNPEVDEVETSKQFLGQENVFAVVGEVVEGAVDPDMCSRIHKRAGASFNLGILPLAILIELDLLHVGLPVYFSV